ncbi:malate dehydrogenase [Cupriavidus sp. TA19]|uniref:Ldh family oxidoreductase n=1 Tax=Cupriavidus sp. TA19 TaxID=701108 RepID=UPI0027294A92|nr:Ldh family oxidoreductase [Cupriavidus sp. TA19]GLC93230.1 malate dehydrogenase [Cupriavidus sp. TA19]
MRLEFPEAKRIAHSAIKAVGASDAIAHSLTDAVLSAELAGSKAVGFAHLTDYLDGFTNGRIAKDVEPKISFPAGAAIVIDAQNGIAQLGFDRVFEKLIHRADTYGVVVLALSNSYTVGELGYYTRRLAGAGLVAMATCNAPAQMTTLESGKAVYGTNSLSFAAPVLNGWPLVIDQSCSATAFVNVRRAAQHGEAIPEGWAVNEKGEPTTDAREAVKGLLLVFGGMQGGNIALITEILAAGVTGANWSMDAPTFSEGSKNPGVGLFLVAIKPELLAGNFIARLASQISRLAENGVRIPGSNITVHEIDVPESIIEQVKQYSIR